MYPREDVLVSALAHALVRTLGFKSMAGAVAPGPEALTYALELKALADACPEGPYETLEMRPGDFNVIKPTGDGAYCLISSLFSEYGQRETNKAIAEFFAAARTGVPALVKAVMERDVLVAELRRTAENGGTYAVEVLKLIDDAL